LQDKLKKKGKLESSGDVKEEGSQKINLSQQNTSGSGSNNPLADKLKALNGCCQ
jgi:hypothetical protein